MPPQRSPRAVKSSITASIQTKTQQQDVVFLEESQHPGFPLVSGVQQAAVVSVRSGSPENNCTSSIVLYASHVTPLGSFTQILSDFA